MNSVRNRVQDAIISEDACRSCEACSHSERIEEIPVEFVNHKSLVNEPLSVIRCTNSESIPLEVLPRGSEQPRRPRIARLRNLNEKIRTAEIKQDEQRACES